MIKEKEIAKPISSVQLSEIVIEAIQDKKGIEIVRLDLRNIEEASADFFVICQGNSPTQVSAIAENVVKHAKEIANEKAIGTEGIRLGEWALVDFFNVVVHVFVPAVREQFSLEDLWGDAKITEHNDVKY